MSVKKVFYKTKPYCKVEFSVPSKNYKDVVIVGDFNNWNVSDEFTFKKSKKRKEHVLKVNLALDQKYQYRYIIDGQFLNDPEADSFRSNPFGTENCVLDLKNI